MKPLWPEAVGEQHPLPQARIHVEKTLEEPAGPRSGPPGGGELPAGDAA